MLTSRDYNRERSFSDMAEPPQKISLKLVKTENFRYETVNSAILQASEMFFIIFRNRETALTHDSMNPLLIVRKLLVIFETHRMRHHLIADVLL